MSGAPSVFVAANCSVANELPLSGDPFRVDERQLLAGERPMHERPTGLSRLHLSLFGHPKGVIYLDAELPHRAASNAKEQSHGPEILRSPTAQRDLRGRRGQRYRASPQRSRTAAVTQLNIIGARGSP